MFNPEEQTYYQRHFILPGFGKEKQGLLKNARVLVVGAGGLGCPALQYLAAAGVGTIGIVDGDVVEKSNLHRQILYGIVDIGSRKAFCAKEKLAALNPHIQVVAYNEYISKENALRIIGKYDVVVDGSDNFQTRYLINDACIMLKKPFVYGALFTFSGQVAVFNYQDGPTYRCLFPEPPAPEDAPNCAEIGVLGVLPGIIGTYQALETIKLLTRLGDVLSGELLLIDALTLTHQKLSVRLNPDNKSIDHFTDYDAFCGVKNEELASLDWNQFATGFSQDGFLLDVRQPYEFEAYNCGGHNIPLNELKNQLHLLPANQPIIIVCQSGKRSSTAQQMLLENGFQRVYNIRGGYNSQEGHR